MSRSDSELVEAATKFAEELESYSRLGDLFLDTPLSSVKYLERANQMLVDIAGCEARLQAAGQQLVKVLAGARTHQEALSKGVVDHVLAVQKRNERLRELMHELTSVAGEVGGLSTQIQTKSGNGDATASPTPADARDVSETALALAARAETLAATARDAEFEELATQAHSLHDRLQAIGKKLAKASG
jgi:methyl-accepting chemotaxis protein